MRGIFLSKQACHKLYGLSKEQLEVVKDHLTFDNPAYKNAKRYSKNRYITIPPYLTYYSTGTDSMGDYISYPIGFDALKLLKYKLNTEKNGDGCLLGETGAVIDYPPFLLDLRPVQKEAEEAYIKDKAYNPKGSITDTTHNLISLPTGKGKTILALHLAYTLKAKTLVLVHKDDLVVGWQKDIDLCFGGKVKCGLIKAKSRTVGEHITIATVQTLSRMSEEELKQYTDEFGLVIQDECHHVGLNIFNIINKFCSRYKLGLSATPKRSDGLDFVFDLFFGGIVYEYKAGSDDEDICGVDVEVLDSNYKYRPFMYKGQVFNYYDFEESELPRNITFLDEIPYKDRPSVPFLTIDDSAVRSSKTRVMVCKKILEHYRQGHSILALFTQKEHINIYFSYLRQFVPENQIILYYGDSREKSENMMKRAENREALITLATYAKATEGTNVKAWEVEFLVSSLNNEKNVEQATGRVRRTVEGKEKAIVYDVRYSGCYSLRSHYQTREKVYKDLEYNVTDRNRPKEERKSMFSRGYKH